MAGGRPKGYPKTGGKKKGTKNKKPMPTKYLFQKGHPKPPGSGRKKGTPNKVTVEQKNFVHNLIELLTPGMDKDVKKMTATGRMHLLRDMTEYILPKLARVNEKGEAVSELNVNIVRSRKVDDGDKGD